MGSVVLKLQLTTRIFWLLFPWPFWAWLLPSRDMATVMDMDMDMAMVDMVTMDTMVRGPLMLSLLLPSPDTDMVMVMDMVMAMDMAMVDMVTMDIMARGLLLLSQLLLLSHLLLLSLDMDMVMDMAMDMSAMAMVV